MFKEFRDFIARGNVLDLAVGIIIGAAFTAIVGSLVEDLINPLISIFTGGYDFSNLGVRLGEGPDAAVFAYGRFLMALINFFIIAWAVFLLVKAVNKAQSMASFRQAKAEAEVAAKPTEIEILAEIRDELKRRPLSAPTTLL